MIERPDRESEGTAGSAGDRSQVAATVRSEVPPGARFQSSAGSHKARRRGLLVGLAALAGLGIAIVWTGWPAVEDQVGGNEAGRQTSRGSRTLSPSEIAERARGATVQIRAYARTRRLEGEGSGFFVSSDGRIATNLHVIEGAYALEIETLAGDVYDLVYFLTADARRDIAILKVPVDDAYPLPLATDSTLDVGESVYVMGNPLGQTGTFSDGLVSARRVVEGVTLMQITAPVSPGSSGGPVMNSRGQVVGVATLMLEGGQNLNYAVPVRYLRPLANANEPPRRYTSDLLPPSPTGVAAVEARRRESPRYQRSPSDVLSSQFREVDSVVRSLGGQVLSEIVRGNLGHGRSSEHVVTLNGGYEYAIAGYCDADCTDIDLSIYTPGGASLASDMERDDRPLLVFEAPENGIYPLWVTMASCAADLCDYGIRLYRLSSR